MIKNTELKSEKMGNSRKKSSREPATLTLKSNIMDSLGIKLVPDADFCNHMATVNSPWRKDNVTQGEFSSFDGLTLRYYHIPSTKCHNSDDMLSNSQYCNPKGYIIMIHGYCEFFGKFHEMVEYYSKAGYEVFFLEQRGHGYSSRQVDDDNLVHVNDYFDYINDLKLFMEKIVSPSALDIPKILFSHSMGGCIATLFLEEFPNYFDGAILSSPMLGIKTGNMPYFMTYFFRAKVKLLHQERLPLPGKKRFDGIAEYSNSSTLSEARYNYIFNQRLNDWHYHTYLPSLGWSCASLKATSKALKNAKKIKIPILLLTAGKDTLVSNQETIKLKNLIDEIFHYDFPNSKHEIYNGNDEIIKKYYEIIFSFCQYVLDNKQI